MFDAFVKLVVRLDDTLYQFVAYNIFLGKFDPSDSRYVPQDPHGLYQP